MEISARLRRARIEAALTQHELARRSGLQQSTIAAYETGRRRPSEDACRRLLTSIGLRPTDLLDRHRDEARAALVARGIDDAHVFGSVARGDDDEGSDIDIMLTPPADADFVDMAEIDAALEEIIGTDVDIVSTRSLDPATNRRHRQIAADAVPL